MLRSLLLLFLTGFAACSPLTSTSRKSAQDYLAPLYGTEHDEAFPNDYMVLFRKGYTLEQHFDTIGRNLSDAAGFKRFSYGYGAILDDETRDEQVRRDPGVELVEADRPVHLVAPDESSSDEEADLQHSRTLHRKREYKEVNSADSPYGLQMITTGKDRLDLPVKDGGTYDYLFGAGQGVQAYIMDTGVRITHELFQGRARNFGDLSSSDKSPYVDETMQDVEGHGTHVAGIIGAEKYGVAPYASLINVKVLGEGGRLREIAQAMIDITAEHNENKKKSGNGFWKFRGSVINMSLSWQGDGFVLLYQLIAANEAGISVFAAAGNKNVDAKNTYPCANVQTRCIAAVDNTYNKAKFSNYGGVVDFIAPGKDILSLGIASDKALKTMSGTSMACPHAAGTAAIFASWQGLTTSYDLSQNFVYWNSISGVVSGFSGTTNNFVTTGIHSPKKYPNEPFRFAGDWPVKNHIVLNATISGASINPILQTAPSVPLTDFATSFYPSLTTSSLPAITGLTTESGVASYDPTLPVSGNATASSSTSTSASTTPASSTVPSSTTSVPTCSGNQIQGSCTQGTLPSATADSGPRGPICDKADGGTYLMFNATQSSDGVSEYCSNLISKGVVLSGSTASPSPGYVSDAAENGGYVSITVLFDVESCDPGTSTADQKLDFSTWGLDTCYEYLYTTLAGECAKDSSWPDYDPDYSIEGGIFGGKCALWSLDGLPGSPP